MTARDLPTSPPRTAAAAGHFAVVDMVRGLASIAVLVWHYQHFYFVEAGVPGPVAAQGTQPFFEPLRFLYLHGEIGVQVFWVISGFVFAHRYLQQSKPVSGRDFFLRRFARLYPLHLATLLLVALQQAISTARFGHAQIYTVNDMTHFVAQLVLASNWMGSSLSFNGPIWSLSVEIIVYAIFFCAISDLKGSLIRCVLAAMASSLLYAVLPYSPILHCALYFFSGTAVFFVFTQIVRTDAWRATAIAASALLFALAVAWLSEMTPPAIWLFSVALVLAGACLERSSLSPAPWMRTFGDLSYASYLIHVPIQIAILMAMDAGWLGRGIVQEPGFFLGFLLLVLSLAHLVHRGFEMPMQRWILTVFAVNGSGRSEPRPVPR